MNLHPQPLNEPITVRQAIGRDVWIEYRGAWNTPKNRRRHNFDKPCLTVRKSCGGWQVMNSGIELAAAAYPETASVQGRVWNI
jgi:hypothetical protein